VVVGAGNGLADYDVIARPLDKISYSLKASWLVHSGCDRWLSHDGRQEARLPWLPRMRREKTAEPPFRSETDSEPFINKDPPQTKKPSSLLVLPPRRSRFH